jgi:glycosyltransferase involved in cell wall biosynthesis
MQRPVLFLARSWHGHGGMQRLNRDVTGYLLQDRGSSFQVFHPKSRSVFSSMSFCVRSMIAAFKLRRRSARIHVADAAGLPLGVICRWLSGGVLSATVCGLDVVYPKRWYQMMLRFCLERCDKVICISDATAEEVHKRGIVAEKITVIPCGIHPEDRSASSTRDPQLLVTVGRLVPRKGVAWFVEHVFPRLLATNPDLHYIIIGDGPEHRKIALIIDRLHLSDSVSIWTDASDDVCKSVLDTASLFVAPNIHIDGDMEGFGIVCLEAGERGLQIAAANIEGLKDAVIDGQTGRFFESENADDCVRVIGEMLRQPLDPSVVRTVTLDHFSWEQIIPLYHDVFDR